MLRRDLQGMSVTMASPHMSRKPMCVIGGAGFAGLALAIALRQGLGDPFAVTVIDPALGACPVERPARFGHRRRGAAAVRSDRGLGCGRRRCAADPRHGGHRFKARRRGAAHISCLRRRCRRGRAVRAHDREPAPRGRAGEKAKALGVDLRAGKVTGFEAGKNRSRRYAGRWRVDLRAPSGRLPTARIR